ncbi:hypothetical protein L1987_30229 [Smallanthus sonchifolius]|uniref:Uncharacterized protein n=1 Tax=Smallanthus sonchifolius TaxID=185202 RepID=A0ACB9I1M0_9ASTR|nr:hypothetical protein L1987_30229 [Smallanthus sonchifolius]
MDQVISQLSATHIELHKERDLIEEAVWEIQRLRMKVVIWGLIACVLFSLLFLGWLTSHGTDMKARLDFYTNLDTDMSGHMNELEQDIMQNQERTTTAIRDARTAHTQSQVAIAVALVMSIASKMPPRRNVRNANNNTGNESDDLAQMVTQQLLDALLTLVEQINDALRNDTENVERNSGTNGGHNKENER